MVNVKDRYLECFFVCADVGKSIARNLFAGKFHRHHLASQMEMLLVYTLGLSMVSIMLETEILSKAIVGDESPILINGGVFLGGIAPANGNGSFELVINVKIDEALFGSHGFISKGLKALKAETSWRFHSGLRNTHTGIGKTGFVIGSFHGVFESISWDDKIGHSSYCFDWIYLTGNDLHEGIRQIDNRKVEIRLIMMVEEFCCPEDTGDHNLGGQSGLTNLEIENRSGPN